MSVAFVAATATSILAGLVSVIMVVVDRIRRGRFTTLTELALSINLLFFVVSGLAVVLG